MADGSLNEVNMGEKAIDPQENQDHQNEDDLDSEEVVEDTVSVEEYNAIDSKLDELNSALDFIEAQNDNIYSQLLSLLQSNREIREELAEQNSSGDEVQN
ncbi:UPF0184 protein AAEL002161-like [Ctenocephalides felis]|uniref:UPF0184 protein AAEL002161-like n=1 Tax=Ctenocephalides felis TaxID=7515 RepID=UPI000E6E5847|nr:UPF0184 protein AAEL002161-like [Ctenocephalides felis]XP_026469284.1 UPF0184 protein AAEL002161-like [Ctenocephalides felis]